MILNINKPVGWTSFDVVKKIRSIVCEKKVGHSGTLDPFAEGVLVIGTGKDTKNLAKITNHEKEYIGSILLGTLTDTLDIEGEIIERKAVPNLSEKQIIKTLKTFIGHMNQIPPMFSAKKINGKRLYELARKKIEIKRKANLIKIISIDLINYSNNIITISVVCSKGTYIRVLAKDIAEKLGTVGHLQNLKRIRVGQYSIDQSDTIENFQETWKLSEV